MKKIKIAIRNRWTGSIIFEYESENNTVKKTVEEFIRKEITDGKFRANLTDADLTRADLTDADLTRANLTDADLTRADLTRANLTDANLLRFKSDLWRVLLENKTEISGLKQSLIEGKVDGSKYEGECACLKGTIHKLKNCTWDDSKLVRDVSEPSEQWFLQISKGDTPENSTVVKKTMEWIEQFESLANDHAAVSTSV